MRFLWKQCGVEKRIQSYSCHLFQETTSKKCKKPTMHINITKLWFHICFFTSIWCGWSLNHTMFYVVLLFLEKDLCWIMQGYTHCSKCLVQEKAWNSSEAWRSRVRFWTINFYSRHKCIIIIIAQSPHWQSRLCEFDISMQSSQRSSIIFSPKSLLLTP